MKKWIVRILILIIVLIGLATLYVELNKDHLVRAAIDEANASINGTISYKDADVSFLSSFPDLRITFYDLLVETDTLENATPLFQTSASAIDFSIISLIRSSGPIIVNDLKVEKGSLYLLTKMDGTTNFDIMPTTETTSAAPIDFDISQIKVTESQIVIIDQTSNLNTRLSDLNVAGDARIQKGITYVNSTIATNTAIGYSAVLPDYNCSINANSQISINELFDSISINQADVTVNDLPVSLAGIISLSDDGVDYKIDFSSPSTEIKRLISLIPVYYKNKYEQLESSGSFTLTGNVNGNSNWDYPLYNVALTAKDGSIAYPSLPRKIDELSFNLNAFNNAPNTAYSRVTLENIAVRSSQNILKGNLQITSNQSSYNSNVDIETKLNLQEISEAVLLSPGTQMSGIINGGLKGTFTVDATNEVSLNEDKAQTSLLEIRQLKYRDPQTILSVNSGTLRATNDQASFQFENINFNNGFKGQVSGTIDQPIGILANNDQQITGSFSVNASSIDLNKFNSEDTATTFVSIPNLLLDYQFAADTIQQSDYLLQSVYARGRLSNQSTVANFTIANVRGSQINGEASLQNVLGYGLNGETLSGTIAMRSDQLRLDDWMVDDEETQMSSIETPLIPDNVDLDIDYKSEKIQFKNLNILESLGQVSIRDKKILFNSAGVIFGGMMTFTGTFDTEHENGYHIDLGLKLNELQFGTTAANLKLFTDLIPIATLLEGSYSATLNWQSELSKDYIPDLKTVTAYGEIETKNGQITSVIPVDNFINRFIDIEDRNLLKLSDAKKYFIIEDGKVMVKKIELKKGDVTIALSGAHGFDQQLDYEVLIDIPKSKIKAGGVIDFIQDKIKFSNILKTNTSDVYVQVAAYMGGSVTKPTFSVKNVNLKSGGTVESLDQQIKGRVTGLTDSLTNVLSDTIRTLTNKVKGTIEGTRDKAKAGVDSIRTTANTLIDSTGTIIRETLKEERDQLKDQGKGILDSLKTGNTDSLKFSIDKLFNSRKGQLDSLKNKFPFKKPKLGKKDSGG